MHQVAAGNAIRAVLTEVFKDLLDTTEGCEKIERSVRGIMKSIDELGLRFVKSLESESLSSDFSEHDASAVRHLLELKY